LESSMVLKFVLPTNENQIIALEVQIPFICRVLHHERSLCRRYDKMRQRRAKYDLQTMRYESDERENIYNQELILAIKLLFKDNLTKPTLRSLTLWSHVHEANYMKLINTKIASIPCSQFYRTNEHVFYARDSRSHIADHR
jgi:hypothetical protein